MSFDDCLIFYNRTKGGGRRRRQGPLHVLAERGTCWGPLDSHLFGRTERQKQIEARCAFRAFHFHEEANAGKRAKTKEATRKKAENSEKKKEDRRRGEKKEERPNTKKRKKTEKRRRERERSKKKK